MYELSQISVVMKNSMISKHLGQNAHRNITLSASVSSEQEKEILVYGIYSSLLKLTCSWRSFIPSGALFGVSLVMS